MTDSIEDILATFEALDDWDDRYRYLIDLGRQLGPLPDEARTAANKVQGCASQVWLRSSLHDGALLFEGDSDALIVRGLVALMIALHSGRAPADVLAVDAPAFLRTLGLESHLSPQRSNGLKSMVARMRRDAAAALAATA